MASTSREESASTRSQEARTRQETRSGEAGRTAQATTRPTQAAAMDAYRPSHINAQDAIAFANLKMKEDYNLRHQVIFFEEGDLVNRRLHRWYRVSAITFEETNP